MTPHRRPTLHRSTAVCAVGLISVLGLAACGSSSSTTSSGSTSTSASSPSASSSGATSSSAGAGATSAGKSGKPIHLAMELLLAGLPFTAETQAGAQAAAKELGVTLDASAPSTFDPPGAIAQVNNYLASGVDGIALGDEPAALWTRAIADAVAKTKGNTVAFNSVPLKGTAVKTYVGNDAADLGVQLATETIKAAGLGPDTTGEVIIGICTVQSDPLKLTVNAAAETAKKLLPKATVLPPYNSQTLPSQNFAAWEQEMRAHPKAVLALGSCNQDGDSMIKAKQLTNGKFAIGTSDTSPGVLAGISNGTVAVCLAQNWYLMGYTTIRLLTEAARKETVPPAGWVNTGSTVITKANVADLVAREASPAGQAAFYKPLVAKLWSDLGAATKPLSVVQVG